MDTQPAPELTVPDRVTGSQAAAYLGLANSTIEKMRAAGKGPRYLRLGNRIYYRRRDLDAYLDACVRETQDSRSAA